MNVLNRAYNGLRGFVDQFANSTSGSDTIPQKMENRSAWYAEWDNNYMGELLDNIFTKSILRKVANSYYGNKMEELFEESTELTSDTYPSFYAVYIYCCEILGIYNPPSAYITNKMKGINALSLEVNEKQFILISPKATTCLSLAEQFFLLGHELGHHQQGNLACHTVNGLMATLNNMSEIIGPLVLDTIQVPLKRWCRCSEFNADRAGFLCCQDADAIKLFFLRLGMQTQSSAYADYLELEATHPTLLTRWTSLKKYIEQKDN